MPDALPRILFVCVQNSCRSQMAEGFARKLGRGRVIAESAGSRPAWQVDPRAVRLMREKDVDLGAQRTKGLEALRPVRWDFVVTMGCGDACPDLPARNRFDWEVPDPKDLDDDAFRAVRDRLERLVGDLVERAVQATNHPSGEEP